MKSPFDIKKVEQKYNAKYVGEFPTVLKDGTWSFPTSVFYVAKPDLDKGHKHYFGLHLAMGGKIMIHDASYLAAMEFSGVKAKNGQLLWSSYVHDYNTSDDGSVWIDGGFDYVRCDAGAELVKLRIIEDKVVEVKDDTAEAKADTGTA
jgi:hypothetical protein